MGCCFTCPTGTSVNETLTLMQKRERPITSSSGLRGQRFLTIGLPVKSFIFRPVSVGSEPSQQNATPCPLWINQGHLNKALSVII